MTTARVLVLSENHNLFQELEVLLPKDYIAEALNDFDALPAALQQGNVALLIVDLLNEKIAKRVDRMRADIGGLPLAAIATDQLSISQVNGLLSLPAVAVLEYPFNPDATQRALAEALGRRQGLGYRKQLQDNLDAANRRLNQRLQELNTIYTISKSVASTLNLDEVLTQVIETSINLTQAEEGFILLRERDKLYLRVAKNKTEAIAQRFNIEATDNIAWQVIRSGRPTMLHRDTKIATGYLVRSLLYVPLMAPGRGAVGVLGVVNLLQDLSFTEHHLFTLSSLADYSAIAVENARLFTAVEAQRYRLSSILEHAAEAIMVVDTENHLLLWSKAAAEVFALQPSMQGQPIETVLQHIGLRELFQIKREESPDAGIHLQHSEIELEDERVFNAQLSSIDKVGRVAIMQNITHLKELDRLKSEFVSTVSHDLRTPLTTVQGYIELLDRVGTLTDLQKSFIQKALNSLHHITMLISDLLDIGRIEAGYDLEMQPCRMDEVIKQTVDEYLIHAEREEITLSYELPDAPLYVLGNRNRLRQVLQNLVSNAIKYNRDGGWVKIVGEQDEKHVIIEVQDSGFGIPIEEQPKIFDRFYRVQSQETEKIHGTGLGLAIVKSVIEKHKGRIWVKSKVGEGSVFSFLVPKYL
ncbi:MAG: GAF domain-containing protein [Anaerolineae bacterium]|nr:GAF domain-containing protein [Anaerolineae bacterium]